jgi:spore maturation protein CgeB
MKFHVNYRNFIPIREGLQAQGMTVLENRWNPAPEELQDCAGYLIDMYDAMKRPWDTLRLKAKLRRRGIPLIGWNRDAPWNKGAKARRLWWFKRWRVLDIYCAHSLQGAESFCRETHYLPSAAWTRAYHLSGQTFAGLREPAHYRYDVSFVGNLDAKKYPEFGARVDFFRALEKRLQPLGVTTWFHHGKELSTAEQVELIQRSRININFGAACDDGPEKSWGLPERCYGVPACGGFLLSEARVHAKNDFVPDAEWIDFADTDQCVERVRFYLSHFDAARDVAERAHARVVRDHTYEKRAATLLALAQNWRKRHGIEH